VATIAVIDIGNTRTKIGCFWQGRLIDTEIIPTDDATDILTPDLLGQVSHSLLEGVAISSVVPAIRPGLTHCLEQVFQPDQIVWLEQSSGSPSVSLGGVDLSAYVSADTLGADRIANLLGAYQAFPQQNVLVCDFGTTTTMDLLDQEGCFLGGAICPGTRLFQSLVGPNHAAQLPQVDLFTPPSETPGLSTSSSIANGLYYGYKGIVLEIVGNLLKCAQWPFSQTHLVFTGGDAASVREMMQLEMPKVFIDPHLTLNGLYAFWSFNVFGRTNPSVISGAIP
jgi:type III pantothenate kinase